MGLSLELLRRISTVSPFFPTLSLSLYSVTDNKAGVKINLTQSRFFGTESEKAVLRSTLPG